MINSQLYTLLDFEGFKIKEDAYRKIDSFYKDLKGVTVYFDDGLWYIVQSNKQNKNSQMQFI